jgi:malonate-semialdehyde dehydrogenase (acetylating)/methylmalonate-semialdehyde dehydrogenase
MTSRITHFINGQSWAGKTERHGEVFNPATGQVTGHVDFASVDVVDEAVAAAKVGYDQWHTTSLARRTQVLFAFRELLNARKGDVAALITAEHGKVLSDALGEVTRGLEVVEFACGIPHLLKGGYSESVSTGVDVYSIRQPLGVVAIISPFNFPAMVPMWFFPMAIATGNAVVIKPSEKDPSAINLVAELWKEAGLPASLTCCMVTKSRSIDCLNTQMSRRFHSSDPLQSHVTYTKLGPSMANGFRRSAAPRITWSYSPMQTLISRPMLRSTQVSALLVNVAWLFPRSSP